MFRENRIVTHFKKYFHKINRILKNKKQEIF